MGYFSKRKYSYSVNFVHNKYTQDPYIVVEVKTYAS